MVDGGCPFFLPPRPQKRGKGKAAPVRWDRIFAALVHAGYGLTPGDIARRLTRRQIELAYAEEQRRANEARGLLIGDMNAAFAGNDHTTQLIRLLTADPK